MKVFDKAAERQSWMSLGGLVSLPLLFFLKLFQQLFDAAFTIKFGT